MLHLKGDFHRKKEREIDKKNARTLSIEKKTAKSIPRRAEHFTGKYGNENQYANYLKRQMLRVANRFSRTHAAFTLCRMVR